MTAPNPSADVIFHNTSTPPGSSISALEVEAHILVELQSLSPSLKIYTPSHPSFKTINTYFNLSLTSHPLAITRPTTILQVSQILSFTKSHSLPFTIRSGGHDSYGRSTISGSLIIDVRELDEIVLSSDQKSVTIGGGVISENLTNFLASHGLVAVQGGCSSVGYTNWAACGGYGTLNGRFGMGCDQIIGARIVNCDGGVVKADEEMLWGLRGGGCAFGVVASLDVKVYRLEKMIAGLVAFSITEARDVLLRYRDLLAEKCPDAYGGLMGLMAIPGVGKVLMFMFTWASENLKAGWEFLQKLRILGKVVMDTVKETTLAAWTEVGKAFSPTFIYTNIRTAYVKELSEPFVNLLLKHVDKIPTGTKAMFIVHVVHGQATKKASNSCFGMKKPHIWVGIHGQTLDEKNKQEASAWSDEVVEDLEGEGLLMKGGYVALMGGNEPVEDCFGGNWARLKDLKKKLDPNHFFQHTVPSLA